MSRATILLFILLEESRDIGAFTKRLCEIHLRTPCKINTVTIYNLWIALADMEPDRLDKKSVMTFIASCLLALQTTDVTGNPHVTSPDISSQSGLTNAGSQSSLFSIASTVDVSTFSDSLEKVLVWLQDATDAVTSQSPVASDIETLKDQFHRHEVRACV